MISTLIMILLVLISYILGCFSTAKILAKSYKNINIYKIGTGHPDTLNIFNNIDKALGIFTGILDIGKVFFYLAFIKVILFSEEVISALPGLAESEQSKSPAGDRLFHDRGSLLADNT